MKAEDFISADMMIEGDDYNVRDDETIVMVFSVASDRYEGDLELTREEIEAALAYAEEQGFEEVADVLFDSLEMMARAEREPDPRNPDLNRLLFEDLDEKDKPKPNPPKPNGPC